MGNRRRIIKEILKHYPVKKFGIPLSPGSCEIKVEDKRYKTSK